VQSLTTTDGVILSETEISFVAERLNLSLGRYKNVISRCEISFACGDMHGNQSLTTCMVSLVLNNAHTIEVKDMAENIENALVLTLERTKRNLDMHLRRFRNIRFTLAGNTSRI